MELLNNAATIFIPLFVTAWLLIKKQRLGGALLVVTFCSVLVNVVLKEIFRINPRSGSGFQLSQYSFPSLSSQLVITFWLYVALRKKRIIFFVIALILVMFVSFQRILSGQHSVPDVVGGMVVGFVVVLVFLYQETKMMKDTWTRMGIEERFPDPLTPLSQDIFTIVYTLSAKESLEELNLQSTRFIPQYKIFNGYLYHNFDVKRLPKLKLIKLIINFYAHASNAEKEFDRVILDRDAAFFSVLDQVNWKSLSNSKVLELLEQTQGKFTRRMVYETKVAFISEGVTLIAKLMTKLALGKELRMSNGEVESITVDKQLVRLVKDLRYDNTFNRKFNRFIQKYRYRLITYDLISPSWEEEPDKVLNIIRRYGSDPINKVLIKLTGKKTLLKTQNKWVWLARKYYSLKEARYDSRMMYFYWLRKILLQIGKNLVKTNIVGQDEDVFFVSLQNLKDLASKRKGDLQKLRQQIGVKREEWKKQFELNPPSEFVTYERKNWTRRMLHATELKGVTANRGNVIGTCKIITTIDQFSKLKKGEILVAPTTNPAWTSLFGLAGGVITETGGVLSHAAIVAREYGIPCLVNVKEATHVLHDGDVVEVDAIKAIVKKLL